jgi:putative flippase GtrA
MTLHQPRSRGKASAFHLFAQLMPMPYLLLRFVMICGFASVAYMVFAVMALESLRLVSGDEPDNVEKVATNVLALLVGAALAFWGLRRYGGSAPRVPRRGLSIAFLRWLAVVTGALAIHEMALFVLLHWSSWSWVVCETAALGLAGSAAFLASRRWVFS